MKTNRILYFTLAIFGLAVFSMCDYVKKPYQNIAPAPSTSTTGAVLRKFLIEDYTGHTCGNCPKAVDTINSIMSLYPGRVIAVGIHSGFYATLSSPNYTYDFVVPDVSTPGYNELDNFFQISTNGNPNGMVSRKDYNTSTQTHVKGIDQWKGVVASMMNDTAKVKLTITNTTDTISAHTISSTITATFLEGLTGNYKIATMVIEDSIIQPQKDYRFSPDDVLNYHHRHVLRAYMFGAFGEQIGTTDPVINSTATKTYSIPIPAKIINIKHCAVVTYVYDAVTYEILQVEESDVFH